MKILDRFPTVKMSRWFSYAITTVLFMGLLILGLVGIFPFVFSAFAVGIGLLGAMATMATLYLRMNVRAVDHNPDFMPAPSVPGDEEADDDIAEECELAQKPIEVVDDALPETLESLYVDHQVDIMHMQKGQKYRSQKQAFIAKGTMTAEAITVMEQNLKPTILELKKQRIKTIFFSATDEHVESIANTVVKYRQVLDFEKEIDAMNQQLVYLTQTRAGDATYVPFIVKHQSKDLGCDKEKSTFVIVVADRFKGYTVHSFLHTAANYVSDRIVPFKPYDGKRRFTLTYQQFIKLREFLRDLIEWYEKGTSMLSALFGEDATPFITVGVKPFSEIAEGERKRAQKFIDPRVLTEMCAENKPTESVLLIEQITLNITRHRYRDEYKQLLEHFYDISGLRDNKGEKKTFIRSRGAEYTSMLSTVNIKAISAHVMYHAIIESKARDMGMNSLNEDFYGQFTIPDSRSPDMYYVQNNDYKTTYYAYILACLHEIGGDILKLKRPADDVEMTLKPFRMKLQSVDPNDYHGLRETLMRSLGSLLDEYLNVTLTPLTPKHVMTEENVKQFIVEAIGPTQRRYEQPYPVNAQEVDALVRKIRSSAAYQDAVDSGKFVDMRIGKNSIIDRLATAIKNRMKNFHPGLRVAAGVVDFYDPSYLIPGLDAFAKMVYKLCHTTEMEFSLDAINGFWTAITNNDDDKDFFDPDFCNGGFSGRLQEIEIDFSPTLDDPIYQAALFLRSSLSKLLFSEALVAVDPDQTAHNFPQIENIHIEIGIASGVPTRLLPHLGLRNQFFQKFAQSYSPAELYKACYKECVAKFEKCRAASDDEGFYRMFKALTPNYTSALTDEDRRSFDQGYRINCDDLNSPWSIAKFLDTLPSLLIHALLARLLITPEGTKELVVRFTDRTRHVYKRAPAIPAQVFQRAPPAAAPAALAAARGVFAVAEAADADAVDIRNRVAAEEKVAVGGVYAVHEVKAKG